MKKFRYKEGFLIGRLKTEELKRIGTVWSGERKRAHLDKTKQVRAQRKANL